MSCIFRAILVAASSILLAASPSIGQCLDDASKVVSPQLDFDALFRTLDDRLVIDFPEWQSRYNQENTTDPSPAFGDEDNCQNGLNDDDHLDMLAAVLDGEPVGTVLAGLDPAEVSAIRTGFSNNRSRISGDLTFRVLGIVEVGIITIIEEQDPGFAEELKDLIAAYMTIGDAESVAFMRGFLITLSEIFIEQGVDNGDIPAFVEGATKSAMRSAVNNNFVGSNYASFGDVAGTSSPNILGDTGNLDSAGDNNETTYASVNGNRQAFMIGEGITRPTIQIIDFAGTTSVQSGEAFDLTVTAPGGGLNPAYDWKKRNTGTGVFEGVGTDFALPFPYPLPADTGDYLVVRCDEHWVRVSGVRTINVTTKPFQIVDQPQDQSAAPGEDVTLSVTVEGGTAVPTYQWLKGATAGNLSPLSSATDATLRLEDVTAQDAGFYQVVATGADKGTDNLVSNIVEVTVTDNPPVVTLNGANPLTLDCPEPYVEAGAMAEDDLDGDLTEGIVITGAVDTTTPDTYTVTYAVSDSGGKETVVTRTVVVRDVTPPELMIIGIEEQTVECGAPYEDPGVIAEDACEGDLTETISVTGSVDTSTPGVNTLTYTVLDTAGNQASLSRTVTVQDTTPPQLMLSGEADVTLACGAAYVEAGASALDACDGDVTEGINISGSVNTSSPGAYPVMYTVTDAAGNQAVATRTVTVEDTTPPGLNLVGSATITLACGETFDDPGATTFDACDGFLTQGIEVSGNVETGTPGEYTLTYSVSDAADNRASTTRTVTVVDETAPSITLVGDAAITLECGTPFEDLGATASDACDGDLTEGVSAEGDVDPKSPGSYTVTYSVADTADNTATATRTVTVVDTTAPVLELVGADPLVLECGVAFSDPGATATDTCAGDLSAQIAVSGSVNASAVGDYILTYSVQDSAGNTASATRTVRVVDETAPALILNGANPLTVSCGATLSDPGATAEDGCDGDLTEGIARTGAVDVTTPGTYTWTYTVTDGAGNTTTRTRTIEARDTTAPVLTLNGADPLLVACGETFVDPGAMALDACEGDLTVAVTASGTVDTSAPGTYTRTYSVTDQAGETSSIIRTVEVRDTTPPVVTVVGANPLTLDCQEAWDDPGATALDGCDGNLTATLVASGEVNTGVPGTYRVTYRVTDTAGNTRDAVRTVVVRDNCPLSIVQQPRSATVYTGQMQRFLVRTVGGDGPLTYTWTRDGENVQSGPLNVLEIAMASEADAGTYVCTVTDGTQSVTSEGVTLTVIAPASEGFHTADVNADWVISLGELLRVVQLYNLAGIQCDATAEDGFRSGSGDTTCAPHSSDYAPQDWRIGVNELLRLVQFYNVPNSTYHAENGTEDGFAPGPG
jgi:hypothetical protein